MRSGSTAITISPSGTACRRARNYTAALDPRSSPRYRLSSARLCLDDAVGARRRHALPPSRWQTIMLEAKEAFDAYQPLYLKSRPSRLTARIMARMNEGYSALASDPQFRTLFKA